MWILIFEQIIYLILISLLSILIISFFSLPEDYYEKKKKNDQEAVEIKLVETGLSVDIEELKKIIIDEWQSGNLYKFYYDQGVRGNDLYWYILDDLSDYADNLFDEIETGAQKSLGCSGVPLDLYETYPKSDVRSIGFSVLNFLEFAWTKSPEEISAEDIPVILAFLDTPVAKSLEAWDKWDKYWGTQKTTEWIELGTAIKGDIREAEQVLDEVRQEFESRKLLNEIILPTKEGGQRKVYKYEDGSFVQLKTNRNMEHPKIVIIDALRKNKEKITFQ